MNEFALRSFFGDERFNGLGALVDLLRGVSQGFILKGDIGLATFLAALGQRISPRR